MENTIDTDKVLRWYTGKARSTMMEALNHINDSCVQNYWVPGASRRVTSMLSKASVALKMGRQYGRALEQLGGYDIPNGKRGWDVMFLLRYGAMRANIDFPAVKSLTTDKDLLAVIGRAEEFYNDMAPLRAVCKELDSKRPLPVITYLEVSPTVTRLLEGLGLAVNIATLRLCPSKVIWDSFGNSETEISARWLVWFAQDRGKGWAPFTKHEIEDFYRGKGMTDGFTFNNLIDYGHAFSGGRGQYLTRGGWIARGPYEYSFTQEFVAQCFKSSPKEGR